MTVGEAGLYDFDSASPWLPGDQQLISEPATSVASGATVALGTVDVARSSYLIACDALYSPGATQPFPYFDMVWSDPNTGLILARERWTIPGTSTSPASGASPVSGRGPTKAAQLAVSVTNPDPADGATVDCYLYQSTRDIARDDWRSNGLGAVPGYTNAATDCPALLPGYKVASVVTSSSSVIRVCGLYSGPAEFCVTQNNSQLLAVTLAALDGFGTLAAPTPVAAFNTSAAAATLAVTLPRCPVLVTVTNAGSGSTTLQWTLTAQEQAS